MPATQAALGYGTTLSIHDGTVIAETDLSTIPPAEFAQIGEIREGPDDSDSTDLVEVTNHQSDNKTREYIGGLIDGGEVTFNCNYLPNDPLHYGATSLRNNIGEKRYFRLTEPGNAETIQVQCVIMNVSTSRPVSDAMQMSVTLKKSGAVLGF